MGFLDTIGLGGLKPLIIIPSWIFLIVVSILIPFLSWGFTFPAMFILFILQGVLIIKSVPKNTVCKLDGGKMKCTK